MPSAKLLRRRALARYENFAGKIVDQMKSALFRIDPTRILAKDQHAEGPILDWWRNIDRKVLRSMTTFTPAEDGSVAQQGSARTSASHFWSQAWDAAGTFGHMFVVMDRPSGPPAVTQADEQAPFLRMYTPLDAIDWLIDDLGNLTAIMFVERAPRAQLGTPEPLYYNLRVFTTEYWALYNSNFELLEGGEVNGLHNLGRIPVVTLYAKRRSLVPLVGHSVLDDPQLYIDLYNLTSEVRELLRNQTFGMLNVQLGADETVQEAQANLGQMSGTEAVLFSKGAASWISPSAANVEAYRNERADLIRSIYRLAAVTWESDSKDAEAKGSLKLKREDLNQMLSGFADELERAEIEIAELYYRATYGPDTWEARWDDDQVVVQYPDTFDPEPFEIVVQQAEAAIAMDMPTDVMKAIRKRLLGKFLPGLTKTQCLALEQAIDAATEPPAADVKARLQTALKTLQAQQTQGSGSPEPDGAAPLPPPLAETGQAAA